MKKLIFINGTMGVGKTTISQHLKTQLGHSVFLDGDWCWDASPFVVNDETKEMVMDNITHMLNNFLSSLVYEHIIFCWVMDEQKIINEIISKLIPTYELFVFSLVCDEETLVQRIQKDIKQGLRTNDVLTRSIARLEKYQQIDSMKIDVSKKEPQQVVDIIQTMIQYPK